MKPNPHISNHVPAAHGGIFSVRGAPKGVLDFSSSINPLGASPAARKAIRDCINTIQTYPDPESLMLRRAIGRYVNAPPSRITVGNGATEIIHNFCRAFLSPDTPVLIPAPAFGEYEAAARLAGARPEFLHTMSLEENMDEFLKDIPSNGCVFVCNPSNPAGTLASARSIGRIAREADKKGSLVFVDECFIEMVPKGAESAVPLTGRLGNMVVLRSLTKSFALAGLRVGYCISSAGIAPMLHKAKIPWNVSGMAQAAAVASLSDSGYLDRARKTISAESDFLRRGISGIDGLACVDGSANYILVRTDKSSTAMQRRLLDRNILVRDCKSFRGITKGHIRVAVRTREDNQKLLKELEAAQ